MVSVKNFHHPGDLDPYPATNALSRLHPHSRRATFAQSGLRHSSADGDLGEHPIASYPRPLRSGWHGGILRAPKSVHDAIGAA